MIVVRVFNAHPERKVKRAETIRVVRRVLTGERKTNAQVNVVFVDDRAMLKLNTTYLRHRYPTDVLSFPLGDEANDGTTEGEVYVNLDQAKRQAREYDVTIGNEVYRLVIHGILHLIGYKDNTNKQRQRMTELEDLYLSKA